jgi:hypothetical protein
MGTTGIILCGGVVVLCLIIAVAARRYDRWAQEHWEEIERYERHNPYR